jgi:hypothetical protein
MNRLPGLILAGVVGLSASVAWAQEGAPAAPRDNLMKVCGDKWRAVREAETAAGVTWPQYLSRCRAQAASAPAAVAPPASAPPVSTQPAAPEPREPRRRVAAAPPSGPGEARIVFPHDVAARHASERPALARQRTCADQFRANKAEGSNAGLRWIEKGGGYWSRCNAHLKQLRA